MFHACCALNKLQGLFGFCRGRMRMVGIAQGWRSCLVWTCRERKSWSDMRAQKFPFPAHQGFKCPTVLPDPCPWRSVAYARPSGNKWRLQWWLLEWHKWALWYSCQTRGFGVHSLLEGRGMYCFALPKLTHGFVLDIVISTGFSKRGASSWSVNQPVSSRFSSHRTLD